QRLDQHRDVVRVARDDVQVAVVSPHQGRVVDAPGVHLPEPELGALGHEPDRVLQALIDLFFVLVADGGAVDHDRRPLQRLQRLVLGAVAQFLERLPLVGVDRQGRSPADQVVDFGALGDERGPLVEGHLVDAEVLPMVGEQADQRLPDRAGSYDVDDVGHGSAPATWRDRKGTGWSSQLTIQSRTLQAPQNWASSVLPTNARVEASPPLTMVETASK